MLALGGTVRVSGGVARACGILAVSRAFGNAGIKHCVRADPEVTEVDLARVDTCVLCSDGLTDVVDAEKMLECARGFGGASVRERRAAGTGPRSEPPPSEAAAGARGRGGGGAARGAPGKRRRI